MQTAKNLTEKALDKAVDAAASAASAGAHAANVGLEKVRVKGKRRYLPFHFNNWKRLRQLRPYGRLDGAISYY